MIMTWSSYSHRSRCRPLPQGPSPLHLEPRLEKCEYVILRWPHSRFNLLFRHMFIVPITYVLHPICFGVYFSVFNEFRQLRQRRNSPLDRLCLCGADKFLTPWLSSISSRKWWRHFTRKEIINEMTTNAWIYLEQAALKALVQQLSKAAAASLP